MAYENREGQGSLFVNDRKTSDRQPQYKGKIFVGGRWYWLSAWLKQSQRGETFMSLQADPMEQHAPQAAPMQPGASAFMPQYQATPMQQPAPQPAPQPQAAPMRQMQPMPHQATGLSLAELSGEIREQDPDLPF